MTCKLTQYNILIFGPPARFWLSPTLQSPLQSPPHQPEDFLRRLNNGVEFNNDLDLDMLDSRLAECDLEGIEEDNKIQPGESFDMGDSIGKALSLVKQVFAQ